MHPAFPSPADTDAEDVAWGLQTGAALWKQGERYDAIVWLKRAVDAAAQAGLSTRADELNRAATELLASLSGRIAPEPSVRPKLTGPPPAPAVIPAAPRAPPPPPPSPVGAKNAGLPPLKPPPMRARAVPPPAPPGPPPPVAPPVRTPAARARGARSFPPLPAGAPPARPTPVPPRVKALPFVEEDEPQMYPSPIPSADPETRPNPALIDAAIREALSQPPPPVVPVLEDAILAPPQRTEVENAFPRPARRREPLVTDVDEEVEVDERELGDETIIDSSDEDQTISLRSTELEGDDDETLSLRTSLMLTPNPDEDQTISVRSSQVLEPGSDDDETLSLRNAEITHPQASPLPLSEPVQAELDEDVTIPIPSLRAVLDTRPPGGEPSGPPPIQSVPVSMSGFPTPAASPMPPAPPPPPVSPARPVPPPVHHGGGGGLGPARAPLRSSPIPPAPGAVVRQSSATGWGTSPAAPFRQSPLPPLPPSVAPPPISLDALGQLGPSYREALLKAATIESLGVEEEVTVSGLAFVITGQASIQATIAEAEAGVLNAGELLYAKSPIAETVSLRLVAESEQTQIALWDAKAAEEALSAAPELLEKLKVASARAQAIVGCSMGAMGERLDESLRTLAIERLETRILQPHEVLAHAGLPVPGMVIVGVGSIELDDDGGDKVRDHLMQGDFLFATEVLGGEAAPATARAGAKGAIVLFGARAVAHELLVTCPPLLEIFAGM